MQNILLLNKVKADFKTGDASLATQVHRIVESALNDFVRLFPSDKKNIKFETGNLKLGKIQDTFKKHGLRHISESHEDQIEAFNVTVSNRNNLAHGDLTFTECGKKYSLLQLEGYRDQIFLYLDQCINETEAYINARLFARTIPPAA